MATRTEARRAAVSRAAARREPRGVRRQVPPAAVERQYAAQLRAVGERLRDKLAELVPRLVRQVEEAGGMTRLDAVDATDELRAALEGAFSTAEIESLARAAARATTDHQRAELGKQIEEVLGTQVGLRDPSIPGVIRAAAAESAALVRGLRDETVTRVARLVATSVGKGQTARQLSDELLAIGELAPDRAARIARDQVGKIYGAANKARQTELGVTHYIWRCSRDQRVRGRPDGKYPKSKYNHWERDGKRFAWSEPPPDGHPGHPVNCRCTAEPDFSELVPDEQSQAVDAPDFSIARVGLDPVRAVPHRTIEVTSAPAYSPAAVGVDPRATQYVTEVPSAAAPPTVYGPKDDDAGAERLARLIENGSFDLGTHDLVDPETGEALSLRTYRAALQLVNDRAYDAERAEAKRRQAIGVVGRAAEDARGLLRRVLRRK